MDVETRWNSTYQMLEVALKHHKAFELLALKDNAYIGEMNGEKGRSVPSDSDWEYTESIVPFLRVFSDATIRVSERMRVKYEKYWSNPDSVNMLLLIAIQYQSFEEVSEADTQDVQANNINTDLHSMGFFLQTTGRRTNTRSEHDRYLQEECEPYSHKFDILNWWKVNSTRFPILGNMAREVLAIPVSTVVLESVFSTERRVLDPYRSSLTPRMLEALVCTGDWLKKDLFSAFDDDGEVLQQVYQDIFFSNDGACFMTASIDNLDDD
ncbi:zinc finger BED domain-containing protein RICESLEEPER 2-like [Arachis hypogaea]|uniref:zinc finger BED domain-containing protein RICESLEEPER 2-like n=1 Tax=Arachis hypogaea TaxID=3818 RepID=UPI003B20C722